MELSEGPAAPSDDTNTCSGESYPALDLIIFPPCAQLSALSPSRWTFYQRPEYTFVCLPTHCFQPLTDDIGNLLSRAHIVY